MLPSRGQPENITLLDRSDTQQSPTASYTSKGGWLLQTTNQS